MTRLKRLNLPTPCGFSGGGFSEPDQLLQACQNVLNSCCRITRQHEMSDHITTLDALPDSAFLRESHLVQSPKRPGVPAPLPFSANTLWRKVKAGEFPAPVKLGPRITAWKVADVRAWISSQTATV